MKKTLLLSFLLSLNANAEFDFLTSSGIVVMAKKQIAKQNFNLDLNILTLPLTNGLSESLNAKARSEPSYMNGYYTRLDQMTLSTNANVNSLLDLNNLPFGFNMAHNAEIIFARQFKSQLESVAALPYNLIQNFPINAEKAKNNLNIGDFVSFHANLNFVVSKTFYAYYNAGLFASTSAYALLSGDFLINLFKIDKNKVRVKFIANRGKGIGANAGAGYVSPLKVVNFNYINKHIVDWVNVNVNASSGKNYSDIFLMDLVFDLNDSKAALAYTNLISAKAVFKDVGILNPVQSADDLASKLLTDMSDIEAIYNEDKGLPESQRRVNRIFKGSNSADINASGISVGLKIFDYNNNKSFVRNRIANTDKDDNKQKYLFDVFSKSHKFSAFFDTFGSEEILSSNMLLTAKEDWTPDTFIALALSREIRRVNFSESDLAKVKESIAQLLPKEQYDRIDWKDWKFPKGDILNASFKNTLFFHKAAISQIPHSDSATLKKLFTSFLEQGARPSCTPLITKQNNMDDSYVTSDYGTSWVDHFEEDINKISTALSISFSATATAQERYDAFLQVKDFPIFLEKGAGFLISLLPAEKREELVSYELSMSATGVEPVSFKFGVTGNEQLYKSLVYIQSIINNRSFDLRLYTDENGAIKAN
jgi:hypothetical protein